MVIPWQGGAVVNNNGRTLETWARTVETVMTLDGYKTKFSISNIVFIKKELQIIINFNNFRRYPLYISRV
jgi:hypothetical protein